MLQWIPYVSIFGIFRFPSMCTKQPKKLMSLSYDPKHFRLHSIRKSWWSNQGNKCWSKSHVLLMLPDSCNLFPSLVLQIEKCLVPHDVRMHSSSLPTGYVAELHLAITTLSPVLSWLSSTMYSSYITWSDIHQVIESQKSCKRYMANMQL